MKNIYLRIIVLVAIIIPVLFFQDFYAHFYVYLTGSIIDLVAINQWHVVIFNIVAFMLFMIPLSFRRKANWKEYGLVTAFFVSLFVEMYGIPLTIMLSSNYFHATTAAIPGSLYSFNMLGVDLMMDIGMLYGFILMTVGTVIVVAGWVNLYMGTKNNKLMTKGMYSYSRHPQYLGFVLVVLGWFIGWPTILTLILSPIMIYKYVSVCKVEEKEIRGPEYEKYRQTVPFFI